MFDIGPVEKIINGRQYPYEFDTDYGCIMGRWLFPKLFSDNFTFGIYFNKVWNPKFLRKKQLNDINQGRHGKYEPDMAHSILVEIGLAVT